MSCSEASNQQTVLMENNMPIATISTSAGEIKIELDKENAPISVDNFISLANSGYYTDTIFHRIIEGFMIQGRSALMLTCKINLQSLMRLKMKANNGLKNDRGTIAMARTMDPHSATSQFFINHADNDFLNFSSETTQGWGYAVFGKVIEGMEVVDSIALSPTMVVNGYQDAPANPVTINSVSISE